MKHNANGNGLRDLELDVAELPKHIAVIMDGNGRWAQSRGLPRIQGHRAGAKTVQNIVEHVRRLGIRYLTLFAFSTENWQRPRDEISGLMKIFEVYLKSELNKMLEQDVRLRVIGNLDVLPSGVAKLISEAQERTVQNSSLDFILAISYGGRAEIIQACQQLAEQVKAGTLETNAIDDRTFSQCLYAPDVPDPDLLIRTSGEFRVSNFLLWQIAYSEIIVSDVAWPDFSKEHLYQALREYSTRQRRYGLTGEQQKAATEIQATQS
ncbi:MAG: isoprenyl transferase [Bdellovibrionales bacterium]|nr:isoprenyl transferase [Bdellovibrionales bacterium]